MKTEEQWHDERNEYINKYNKAYNYKITEEFKVTLMVDLIFELKKIAHELKRGNKI